MKNLINSSLIISVFGLSFVSCDKIEEPIKPEILIDTTLFSTGNWVDYVSPTFGENTNTNRNLILEDYTGHDCPNCPTAAIVAKDIEDANSERVFVVSIHAGKGGNDGFQKTKSDCGTASNPHDKLCHDFRTNEGTDYGIKFADYGFVGNPYGNISRYTFSDFMFQYHTAWAEKVDELLLANDLKINIQAKSNYYDESKGGFLHVESQSLKDLSGNYNIVTYVVQNHIEEWQNVSSTYVEDYDHHNVFLGCVDNEAWGQTIFSNASSGDKVETVYSYKLPTGISKEEIHFISYVYDVDTYEIIQVIKFTF